MGQRFMFVDISAFEDISSRFMAKVNTNLTSVLTILPQRHQYSIFLKKSIIYLQIPGYILQFIPTIIDIIAL